MDHGIAAIAQTTTALIPADAMKALLRETSSLGEALWWGTMTDLGVLRERIVDEGRRNAYMRIAHLLYEMLVRYRMVGMTNGNSFVFPVSQIDLADATGLTSVHANRMLRKLRVNGLIKLEGGSVTIIDPDLLKETAQFSGTYLHLDRVHGGASTSPRAGDLV
jgi:CRP-like cAMP-binding protein